jgi:NADH-quinone oxidoreductase subunit J
VLALAVASVVAGVLVVLLVDGFRTAYVDVHAVAPASARVVGESVFRYWILPFEALSLLLLAALVGAITLSRTRAKGE